MKYVIHANVDVCEGFANCTMNAPELFDLDENDIVVVLRRDVSEHERAYAEAAVRSCPVSALSIEPA